MRSCFTCSWAAIAAKALTPSVILLVQVAGGISRESWESCDIPPPPGALEGGCQFQDKNVASFHGPLAQARRGHLTGEGCDGNHDRLRLACDRISGISRRHDHREESKPSPMTKCGILANVGDERIEARDRFSEPRRCPRRDAGVERGSCPREPRESPGLIFPFGENQRQTHPCPLAGRDPCTPHDHVRPLLAVLISGLGFSNPPFPLDSSQEAERAVFVWLGGG